MHPHKKLHEASHTRYYGKCRSNNFFHWKGCLFFGNLCFQQLLRCYRNDLITSTVAVKTLYGPSFFFLRFDILDNTRKLVQKFFFTEKFDFCSSEICVFNNLLRVTEIIFYLPQYLSDYLFHHTNCLLSVFSFDKATKIRPISFHWRACLSLLKIFCFNNILGPEEMIL